MQDVTERLRVLFLSPDPGHAAQALELWRSLPASAHAVSPWQPMQLRDVAAAEADLDTLELPAGQELRRTRHTDRGYSASTYHLDTITIPGWGKIRISTIIYRGQEGVRRWFLDPCDGGSRGLGFTGEVVLWDGHKTAEIVICSGGSAGSRIAPVTVHPVMLAPVG